MKTFLLTIVLFCCAIIGCTQEAPQKPEAAPSYEKLAWESDSKPERKMWSEYLLKEISGTYWPAFQKTADGKRFCANYDAMTKDQQVNMLANVIASIAYYESGWNPKSSSVDVGKPGKKDTYSVGLMQVSVVDQAWAGGNLKYTYEELLTPIPNLHLTLQLMSRQLNNTGLIILPNSSKFRYWAVALEGNKYQQISGITKKVKSLSFCK